MFIRQRARGLALTAAGEEMLRDTRALLAHLDEVLDAAGGHVDQVRGTVRLACFVTLTPFVLPRLLSDLGARHPDLEVEVIETSAEAMRTVLRNGTAELALTYDLALGPGVDTEHLGVAAPYVALPPEHRLARRKSIRLTELTDEPMVLLDLPDSRDYFESMLVNAGVTPNIRYRSASYETVRGLVARGHGFSILNQLPAHGETYDGGTVSAVAIRDEVPGSADRAGPVAERAGHRACACGGGSRPGHLRRSGQRLSVQNTCLPDVAPIVLGALGSLGRQRFSGLSRWARTLSSMSADRRTNSGMDAPVAMASATRAVAVS